MRLLTGLVTGLFMFGMVGIANATLIQVTLGGENLVYDDGTGYYWQSAIDRFKPYDYLGQVGAIALDNVNSYGSIDTWEMADITEANALIAQIDVSNKDWFNNTRYFSGDPTGIPPKMSWEGRTSTEYLISGVPVGHRTGAYDFYPATNTLSLSILYAVGDISLSYGAWVRSASSPNPVPEPATMLLFGTGLVGLAGVTMRRSKK